MQNTRNDACLLSGSCDTQCCLPPLNALHRLLSTPAWGAAREAILRALLKAHSELCIQMSLANPQDQPVLVQAQQVLLACLASMRNAALLSAPGTGVGQEGGASAAVVADQLFATLSSQLVVKG